MKIKSKLKIGEKVIIKKSYVNKLVESEIEYIGPRIDGHNIAARFSNFNTLVSIYSRYSDLKIILQLLSINPEKNFVIYSYHDNDGVYLITAQTTKFEISCMYIKECFLKRAKRI